MENPDTNREKSECEKSIRKTLLQRPFQGYHVVDNGAGSKFFVREQKVEEAKDVVSGHRSIGQR